MSEHQCLGHRSERNLGAPKNLKLNLDFKKRSQKVSRGNGASAVWLSITARW